MMLKLVTAHKQQINRTHLVQFKHKLLTTPCASEKLTVKLRTLEANPSDQMKKYWFYF